MTAFWMVDNQFQKFIDSQITLDYDSQMTDKTDSTVQDESSRSGNDTDADDVDIRPIYDEEQMAKVQLTVECISSAIGTTTYLSNTEIIIEDHMIASSESRNSFKNMPRFSSNDMVHNHYLDEAKKKTQERDRNSKTSVMSSIRFQSTADGSKPKPKSNNQTPRSLLVSKTSCVTITAVPKEDHSKSSSSFSDSNSFVCLQDIVYKLYAMLMRALKNSYWEVYLHAFDSISLDLETVTTP
ncbi:hypothetical protein Tco_0841662 [Tanacetum coccineum]|uniref:Uncharacterized protein n=1 Tax=Tanacetum coccineum TaxID=301880 RepID=A0ABQ5AX70_9ASTR